MLGEFEQPKSRVSLEAQIGSWHFYVSLRLPSPTNTRIEIVGHRHHHKRKQLGHMGPPQVCFTSGVPSHASAEGCARARTHMCAESRDPMCNKKWRPRAIESSKAKGCAHKHTHGSPARRRRWTRLTRGSTGTPIRTPSPMNRTKW